MNLNSILIGSEDPKRLAEYYTKLFGEPAWDDGGYTGWQVGTGWVTVGPHDQVKGKNTAAGPDHLEHRDRRREGRLREVQGRRRDGGAGALHARPGGEEMEGQIATFSDPDDNYFQLMSPMGPPEGS